MNSSDGIEVKNSDNNYRIALKLLNVTPQQMLSDLERELTKQPEFYKRRVK